MILSTNLELLGNASAADENSKKSAASTKVYHHLAMHCLVIYSNAITVNLFSILMPDYSQKVNSMEPVMLYQKKIPSKFIFSCNWSYLMTICGHCASIFFCINFTFVGDDQGSSSTCFGN